MRLSATFRTLFLASAFGLAATGCSKPAQAAVPPVAPDSHPLVGRWIATGDANPDCPVSFEFRDDGALVMSDGQASRNYDGTLSAIDAMGYYAWSGRFRAASGTPKCLGDDPEKGSPMQLHARFLQAGAQLALCESESIETCHMVLGRSPDHPARAARLDDLGLAEPLGAAIERASGAADATTALAEADASPPMFFVAGKPATLPCEQSGAWSIFDGSLVGTVAGSRCANAGRAALLAEQSLAEPQAAAERQTLPDGSTLSYFPVVLIGHGPVALWTAVVVDKAKSSAIVVQAQTSPACPAPAAGPRLCRDPKGLVIDVAKALAH